MDLVAWNAAILTYLQDRAGPGHLVYLYVDQEMLAELSGLPGEDAVEDFRRSFDGVSTPRSRPFGPMAIAARRWEKLGYPGDPVFTAHLALTVLAVTLEPIGASHGVYRRQNSLLGLSADAEPPPSYVDDVPCLWRIWNDWLEKGPGARLGHPTAQSNHEHWKYQGWARSQALIRFSDRLILEDFIAREILPGKSDPDAASFLRWLRYRGNSSLAEKLGGAGARQVVEAVLQYEYDRFQREDRRRRSTIIRVPGLLHYDLRSRKLAVRVAISSEWFGRHLRVGQDRTIEIDGFDAYLGLDLTSTETASLQLRHPFERALAEDLTVEFGGRLGYLLADDLETSGYLEVTRAQSSTGPFRLLAHESLLNRIEQVLGKPRPLEDGPWAEWYWVGVEAQWVGPDLLDLLQVRAGATPTGGQLRLGLGLKLSGTLYLVGGEPDVIVPDDVALSDVLIDGQPLGDSCSIRGRALPSGPHVVESPRGTISFESTTMVRDRAQGCEGADWLNQIAGQPLAVLPSPAQAEILVLNADGGLHQIWPAPSRWLQKVGVRTDTVDLSQLSWVGGGKPFAAITRDVQTGQVWARTLTSAAEGQVITHTASRNDLRDQLLRSNWLWIGPGSDENVRTVMENEGPTSRRRPPHYPTVLADQNLEPGRLDYNPYDAALNWLSEKESGWTTVQRFREIWEWLAVPLGPDWFGRYWRRSLGLLVQLGHVSRDFGRARVELAPAVLTELQQVGGLLLLSGARPRQVLDALATHERTPVDRSGRPMGPTIVLLAWDRLQENSFRQGLHTLGIRYCQAVTSALLDQERPISWAVRSGVRYTASPSQMFRRWDVNGSWQNAESDSEPGLYHYSNQRARPVFAWRAVNGDLFAAEPGLGFWLTLGTSGRRDLLAFSSQEQTLAIPAGASLPVALQRILIGCSGFPARQESNLLIHQNVDQETAQRVAVLLEQDIRLVP